MRAQSSQIEITSVLGKAVHLNLATVKPVLILESFIRCSKVGVCIES